MIELTPERKSQLRKASLKHRYSISYWAMALRNKAKQRAKKLNVPFNLSKEWLVKQLEAGVCSKTGIVLDLSGGKRKPYTPSIDRINGIDGYTEQNTQLVCWIYNAAKSTFTHEDVVDFANAFRGENSWQ